LLFSDKKGTPATYKALSAHFDKTLFFGIVKSEEAGLVGKFKVKTYPALYMVKEKDGKPIKFEGQDYSYQAMFDFINIYSETFVFRGDSD
jgi:Thioredoxin-like domain